MKAIKRDIDIDYIGCDMPLTQAEELEISDYIKRLSKSHTVARKVSARNIITRPISLSNSKKHTAT